MKVQVHDGISVRLIIRNVLSEAADTASHATMAALPRVVELRQTTFFSIDISCTTIPAIKNTIRSYAA
jgi:hypothetical protein